MSLRLTAREREFLEQICKEDLKAKQFAHKLGVRPRSVWSLLSNARSRNRCKTTLRLIYLFGQEQNDH